METCPWKHSIWHMKLASGNIREVREATAYKDLFHIWKFKIYYLLNC
jgi:hypothetical protein